MKDIKEKISKLLSLAKSSNENEAKSALLKARQLMMENKLDPDDCNFVHSEKVIRESVDICVTKRKYSWAVPLSKVIADHYCCIAYTGCGYHAQKNYIGFIGLEDDFYICKKIFSYTFDCIVSNSEKIFERDSYKYTASYRRKLAEHYGQGFCIGLKEAFQKQTKDNYQEWGLVMVVPTSVRDAAEDLSPGGQFTKQDRQDSEANAYLTLGYRDGVEFDPTTRIETQKNEFYSLNSGS